MAGQRKQLTGWRAEAQAMIEADEEESARAQQRREDAEERAEQLTLWETSLRLELEYVVASLDPEMEAMRRDPKLRIYWSLFNTDPVRFHHDMEDGLFDETEVPTVPMTLPDGTMMQPGATPLIIAAAYLKVNHAIAILCSEGLDPQVNALDGNGMAAVHYLAQIAAHQRPDPDEGHQFTDAEDDGGAEDFHKAVNILAAMYAGRSHELDMNIEWRLSGAHRIDRSTPLSILSGGYKGSLDVARMCMMFGATKVHPYSTQEKAIAARVNAQGPDDAYDSYKFASWWSIARCELSIRPRVAVLTLLGAAEGCKLRENIIRRIFQALVDDSVWIRG